MFNRYGSLHTTIFANIPYMHLQKQC